MDNPKRVEELLQRAQQICAAKEYCVSEIAAKIGQWGENDPEIVENVIGNLIAEKFIDEERYCRAFALDHFNYQHWGKVKISAGLRAKKLSSTAIATGLDAIDDEEYRARLAELLEAHRRSVKAKNRYELKGKLVRYALGKGFESQAVYAAVNSMFKGQGSDHDLTQDND